MTINTDDLDAFIVEKRDSRELKRAIAVKMAIKGYRYEAICDILNVQPSFVSEWKQAYLEHGVDGLLLKYKGSNSFLSIEEHQSVIEWLQQQEEWTVERLKTHIEATYQVVFQSRQSYYDLLAEAKITWKKAQRIHSNKNPDVVAAKKKRSLNTSKHAAKRLQRVN
jgi:putative transposase